MKKPQILYSILLIFSLGCSPRRVKISEYPMGTSIEVTGNEYMGYLFDAKMTTKWLSAQKELNFNIYWWIDECNIPNIEICIRNYIKHNMDATVYIKLNSYIRQYFPYISQNGHQMIAVTLTMLEDDDKFKEETKEKLAKYYHSVFDGKPNTYFSFVLDYSVCRESK